MKFTESVRNFFFAMTHANGLIRSLETTQHENKELRQDIQQQEEGFHKKEMTLRNALWAVAPENPSLEYMKELHAALSTLMPYNELSKARERVLANTIHVYHYVNDIELQQSIERETYRAALLKMGVLPTPQDLQSVTKLRENILNHISTTYDPEKLSAHMPVGRIDYLGNSGHVGDSMEFTDAGKFILEAKSDNYCGVPMQITVYSDPATGKHINTSWVQDLDPPPQGYSITPYQEQPEQEGMEQTVQEVDVVGYDYEP